MSSPRADQACAQHEVQRRQEQRDRERRAEQDARISCSGVEQNHARGPRIEREEGHPSGSRHHRAAPSGTAAGRSAAPRRARRSRGRAGRAPNKPRSAAPRSTEWRQPSSPAGTSAKSNTGDCAGADPRRVEAAGNEAPGTIGCRHRSAVPTPVSRASHLEALVTERLKPCAGIAHMVAAIEVSL